MWDLDGNTVAHLANYEPIVASLATHTTAFGKPVLLFTGDSHTYRSDNPLVQGAPCTGDADVCSYDAWTSHPYYNVANFHRIVVHGSTFPLEWLRLTITPGVNADSTDDETSGAFGPFSWQRVQPELANHHPRRVSVSRRTGRNCVVARAPSRSMRDESAAVDPCDGYSGRRSRRRRRRESRMSAR